jgi:Arc/MetJ-type ribon-helix-helix transcriptional regulator
VSSPDFEKMTKQEIVAWFESADSIASMVASVSPATEPVAPSTGVPMMLASIRLPVVLIDQIDGIAASQGIRRSDVIREALVSYVASRTSPVGRDEAERALDVLRRVVADRTGHHPEAA